LSKQARGFRMPAGAETDMRPRDRTATYNSGDDQILQNQRHAVNRRLSRNSEKLPTANEVLEAAEHQDRGGIRTVGNQACGGQGGIRTPGTVTRTPHFECGAFNRSATCPRHCKLLNYSTLLASPHTPIATAFATNCFSSVRGRAVYSRLEHRVET
jgi:hypothetical protein